MMKKTTCIPQGMSKDLNISQANNSFLFDALNVRVTAREHDTLLCITNEKSTAPINTTGTETQISVVGTIIGYCVLDNKLTLFTKDGSTNYIYIITNNNGSFTTNYITGQFGFDTDYPIEAFGLYEASSIQKVYWTDGKNPPRVINLQDYTTAQGTVVDSTTFDFFQPIDTSSLTHSIVKNLDSNGVFPSGIVQYIFTYYNNAGVQSAPFYISDLMYLNPSGRGGSPEETANCSFTITLGNLSSDFEYVRTYRLIRTTIDGTPSVEYLVDQAIDSSHNLSFSDNGTKGTAVTPTDLYYLGGDNFRCKTMTFKDGVLFCGNLKLEDNYISDTVAASIADAVSSQAFTARTVTTRDENDTKWKNNIYQDTFQLDKSVIDNTHASNDSEITFFKYKEHYRFGLQFKDKFGAWSNVVVINPDVTNSSVAPLGGDDGTSGHFNRHRSDLPLSVSQYTVNLNATTLNGIQLESGESFLDRYDSARLVCVYPELQDRTVLCQGIVCPTLFNAQTRNNGTCYAQSDWFSRPMYYMYDWYTYQFTSWADYIQRYSSYLLSQDYGSLPFNLHNHSLPSSFSPSAEIKCNTGDQFTYDALVDNNSSYGPTFEGQDRFFVDYNTVTLHSPDIEFDEDLQQLDLSSDNIEFWAVGKVDVKGAYGKTFVNISDWYGDLSSVDTDTVYASPYQRPASLGSVLAGNASFQISSPIIKEKLKTADSTGSPAYYINYPLYPWHTQHISHVDETDYGTINNKILANLQVCQNHKYATNGHSNDVSNVKIVIPDTEKLYEVTPKNSGITNAYYKAVVDQAIVPNTQNYKIYHQSVINNGVDIVNFPVFKNIQTREGYFDNNVLNGDNVPNNKTRLTIKRKFGEYNQGDSFNITALGDSPQYAVLKGAASDPDDGGTGSGHIRKDFNSSAFAPTNTFLLEKGQVLAIYTTYVDTYLVTTRDLGATIGIHFPDAYTATINVTVGNVTRYEGNVNDLKVSDYNETTSSEGVSIRYKSTPHIVFSFDYYKDTSSTPNIWRQVVVPRYYNGAQNMPSTTYTGKKNFWGDTSNGWTLQAYLEDDDYIIDPFADAYFILGEIRRKDSSIVNRFGGNTPSAYALNKWVPCSSEVTLPSSGTVVLNGTKGDTYFQRYDHLKTQPYSSTDINSIVDIVSFCCETHINVQGRYDKNKGLEDNTGITSEIFNLLNPIYSQRDDWFLQSYVGPDKISALNEFPNQITWSLPKSYGERIDTWTNISLASTLDLDGDKGELTALRRWNDKILFFQQRGLGLVNYNERTVLNTENGLPVQIANSGKVEGKSYLSDLIGCQNPKTIAITQSGLYFADNETRAICAINNEGLQQVTAETGMTSYIRKAIVERAFADKFHDEVYFTTNEGGSPAVRKSLCYNEQLKQFTSFYNYEDADVMANLGNDYVAVSSNGKLWKLFRGTDYNNIFGTYRDYSLTYRVAPRDEQEVPSDNIFDYIEYSGDYYSGDTPVQDWSGSAPIAIRPSRKFLFSTITASNEYQTATANLDNVNTKKKFRVWRTLFPRAPKQGWSLTQSAIHGDRIRNPWVTLTLSKSNTTGDTKGYEMRLYNLNVYSTKY